MPNKVIECMTSEEIVNAISEVNELMKEIEKLYTPFVGMRFDELPTEAVDVIRKLSITIQKLTNAKAELRYVAWEKFGIFVFS